MSRRDFRTRPDRYWRPPEPAPRPAAVYPSRAVGSQTAQAARVSAVLTRYVAQRASQAAGVSVPPRSIGAVMGSGVLGGVRPGRVSTRFGNAPLPVVQKHNRWATNHAPVLNAVNLVKRVVRQVDDGRVIKGLVQGQDRITSASASQNRVSSQLTRADRKGLGAKGVSQGALPAGASTRRNAACLSDNRPTATKGDGSSRPFVAWCQKGGKS